jgi:hypothetical protein
LWGLWDGGKRRRWFRNRKHRARGNNDHDKPSGAQDSSDTKKKAAPAMRLWALGLD